MYETLKKTNDYDKSKAEELANLCNEIQSLREKIEELEDIAKENDDLFPYLWQSADRKFMALHKIHDEHLKNIMIHLLAGGRTIRKEIKAEARSRGLTIPTRREGDGVEFNYLIEGPEDESDI